MDYITPRPQRISFPLRSVRINQKPIYQSASLAETLDRYFAVDLEKSHRQIFTKNWNGIWTNELVNYALSDVVHFPKLKKEQELWLERLGLREEFERQLKRIL